MKRMVCFFKGIGAGAAISLGSILNIVSLTFFPVGKFFGALLFPIGLILVCFLSLNLYTGKIGFVLDSKNKKSTTLDLAIMIIGNIAISFLLGFIFYLIIRKSPELTATVNSIYSKKANMNWFNILFSSILCGGFVYAAVFAYKNFKNKVLKALGIIVAIFLFVYMGYDHCIANSFYFAAGNGLANYQTYVALLISIIGNSIGAIILNSAISK